MRRTQCQGESRGGRTPRARGRSSSACLGLLTALGLMGGAGQSVLAQPPGPEIFAKDPKTPLELWDAVDYLVRTEQAPKAAPYLKKFMAAATDDAALLEVRDRYGLASVLRLQDHPATRGAVEPLVQRLAQAMQRRATDPARLEEYVALLTSTTDEQNYAVDHLRESGSYAVPPILRRITDAATSAEDRATLVRNLGRLDTSAVPALIAALDAPDPTTAVSAARALGLLGDRRAVSALTAASTGPAAAEARAAVERITGQPFDAQPKPPVRLLTDEARLYHTHKVLFPGDSVIVWAWDAGAKAPVPKTVPKAVAENYFGMRYARAALAIDPADRPAQVVLLGLALERAAARSGFDKLATNDPTNTFATAVSAGPAVLGGVLRSAIADGKDDLAAVSATALAKVTDASALAGEGASHPLIEALSAPGRRGRFAAARAVVGLDPGRPFAGSSRVVPALAQFLASQQPSRAVVIDGNVTRGNMIAGQLRTLGYDTAVSYTGADGFAAAAESADTELVLFDHHMTEEGWRLHDTLANLRADARTASLPIYVYAPLRHHIDLDSLNERFPGVKLIVTPVNAQILDQQIKIAGAPKPLPAAERSAYAVEAAALLAKVAGRVGSPLGADLTRVEPTLAIALNVPSTADSTATTLGDVPVPDAQRGLADALVDPSRPTPARIGVADDLARSVKRFGPLVAADQEVKLLSAFEREADPKLRTALGTVIGALRPKPDAVGQRLRKLAPEGPSSNPSPAADAGVGQSPATPEAASPSPEAAPEPSTTTPLTNP